MNVSVLPATSSITSKLKLVLWFFAVAGLVWAQQSIPCWRGGQWLAGSHADGPFHFYCELSRLNQDYFKNDLAVQSNQALGAYETTYRGVGKLAQLTGWSLLETNLVLCWVGNFLYLAGVFALLTRLSLSPAWCALGTMLVAQPYIMLSMSSGVVHSLVIPREFWLWPLPWFIMWFAMGRREGWRLIIFYAALGGTYSLTYPLWAALFGVGFGLADSWRLWRGSRRVDFAWLAAGGVVCAALVIAPALGLAQMAAGGESAVMDYNQIVQSVYLGKGFRRLLIFAALGWIAFHYLGKCRRGQLESTQRLHALLGASLVVCLVYEPPQRLIPTLSLLYIGRLSLITYLISMVAVTIWLHEMWTTWQPRGRTLAIVGLLILMIDPVKHVFRDWRDQSPPVQLDFVRLCRSAKKEIPIGGLSIVPLDRGCHYFRVYAERGLWISPKDNGVLSRTRVLYREAKDRLQTLEAFYAADTTHAAREALLNQMHTNGVTHVVTTSDVAWPKALSWPVIQQQGVWQLRAPIQTP